MKKIISVFLSLTIIVISLFSGLTALAAETKVKFDSQKQQYNSQCTTFNYRGNKTVKIAYDINSGKFKAYYSESLTKKGKEIFTTDEYTGVAIKGNYVFYACPEKGKIVRRKLNGKGAKTIIKVKKNKYARINFIICGSHLIYNLMEYKSGEYKSSKLYCATTKGENKKLIAKNVTSDMYMYKNMLYFLKGKDIMRYDFREKTLKRRYVGLDVTNARLLGMENNILYIGYPKGEQLNKMNFFRADVDKQKFWKFESAECGALIYKALVCENKPCLITMRSEGNYFAAVKGEKADFQTYRSKYEVGGNNLGYWKNNIVLDNLTNDGNFSLKKYVVMVKNK